MSRTICYFDITIGAQPAGRITFELYDELLPKTTENFKQLCIGDKVNASGVKLAYAGSGFHRCIKGFMLQGGDFTKGDGTGGESIYGEKFEDEGFPVKHTKPMLLSMANAGPNTNGSQFFITTVPTDHLDGKHVVFGQVRSNRGLVRRIEALPTDNDKPREAVTIAAAGVLSEEDVKKEEEANKMAMANVDGEDLYEDYPVDEERIDAEKPEEALQVATKLKEIGTREFKAGQYALALDKYQKALRYLDTHPVLPDDAPAPLVASYRNTRFPLLTNASLSALKCNPPAGSLAVSLATRALSVPDLTKEERGKALYRRALGKVQVKDDEAAEKDLREASGLVPGDAGVQRALKEVEVRRKERKEREKKAYAKMFG
ncbi:cyclophilin-like domain-containing protein [Dioszegia hungarica]|uniref:peptidylprolyl isomerase n=1 Tax=Dioszegia hungarica TaxID=4972 RepID=A0AA38LVQ4_9TREE|nr:cyclophilin-like domain-containing protein [Dioszegia hungarica]KAI9636793.1 cyclophilin-like domain-containing protein [Dioszegia hungarica]